MSTELERSRRGGQDPRPSSEGGFALALVVFLLFAIGIAAVIGMQVVQTEARLSQYSGDAGKALSTAEAGLQRYLARIGPVIDTTFQVDGGEAEITPRRTRTWMDGAYPDAMYLISSRGSFGNPAAGGLAERVVRQYAIARKAPHRLFAAFGNSGDVFVEPEFVIRGEDQALMGTCAGAPRDILAVAAGGSISGPGTYVSGDISPNMGSQALLAAFDIPWHVLLDPDFPVDVDGALPHQNSYAGEYRVVRVMGDVTAQASQRGQGVLIVSGQLSIQGAFTWDGVILAGSLAPVNAPPFVLRGALITGLGPTGGGVTLTRGSIQHDSCAVLRAGERMTMLRPVPNSWMEVF